MHETDIIVIGAGPVGLFSIFEAGMMKMRCHVIDALSEIGGQCIALYPEKPIYDIPAHPAIEAKALIEALKAQADPFEPVYHLNQTVTMLTKEGEFWCVKTSLHTEIRAKAIIIAAGCGAFGPNRPPLENIEAYEGKSVHYFVSAKEAFRGKDIVIAGGGDSAIDWALSLIHVARKIYVVHRRPKFRAALSNVEKLHKAAEEGLVELIIPYQLSRLEGKENVLDAVWVETLEGEEKRLEAQHLLAFFGLSMELGPIAEWGLDLHHHHIAVNPATLETNTKTIHAIGDIVTYPGKLKLILCGFSEAAMACKAIYPIIHPNEAFHFEYSTTKGVPAV